MELGSIFLGNTPSDQRKFIKNILSSLKDRADRLIIPCCGQFAIASAGVDAGWKPEQIETSDISLFTNLLGYYYSGKSFKDLPIIYESGELKRAVDQADTEEEAIAEILLAIKICQLRLDVYYEAQYYQEIMGRRNHYKKMLVDKMKAAKEQLGGLKYEIRDLRDYFVPGSSNEVVIINPPAFKNGYTKMFKHEIVVKQDIQISEFQFDKEYIDLFERSKKLGQIWLWYRYKEVQDFSCDEVLFGKEYTTERTDYWITSTPDLLQKHGLELKKHLVKKMPGKQSPSKHKIFDGEITPESEIRFVQCTAETAIYYRDLWAHKMGSTSAEMYYLITIDGMVVGACGFHAAEVRRMTTDRIFEVFAFNKIIKKYPLLNRLIMMWICSTEMQKTLMGTCFKTNRLFDLRGVKTTCLSKYRKVKLNNGLLEVVSREKWNGMYKIVYDTAFHDRDFKQCIIDFLQENGKNS